MNWSVLKREETWFVSIQFILRSVPWNSVVVKKLCACYIRFFIYWLKNKQKTKYIKLKTSDVVTVLKFSMHYIYKRLIYFKWNKVSIYFCKSKLLRLQDNLSKFTFYKDCIWVIVIDFLYSFSLFQWKYFFLSSV